ncbi:glycosyltransferase family 2 protein [Muricoccus radiodurans]|uniref:glycosyltransferase family 2 protein n=1 Tax=Muricoccus radiodurans TaxID=2231721 RepID=UPI003CEDD4FA
MAPVLAGGVAVVIPAYQEAATIADVVARARAALPGVPVIVVDDGSTDVTAALAAEAGAEVIRDGANAGKGAALRRGMRAALGLGAEWVVTLDGDGQHRPEDIPRLLDAARANPGRIILGSRRADSAGAPAGRRRANRVADFWIGWAAGHHVADSQSGFRAYPAVSLTDLDRYEGRAHRFAFESEILIDAARRGIPTVPVDIPALYGATLRRPSHFRPVLDIARIVVMVAGKLLARGMDPPALVRSLGQARQARAPNKGSDA